MKKQIWLRPDQVELVRLSLQYVINRLSENNCTGAHFYVSKPFAINRIKEILSLMEE